METKMKMRAAIGDYNVPGLRAPGEPSLKISRIDFLKLNFSAY